MKSFVTLPMLSEGARFYAEKNVRGYGSRFCVVIFQNPDRILYVRIVHFVVYEKNSMV